MYNDNTKHETRNRATIRSDRSILTAALLEHFKRQKKKEDCNVVQISDKLNCEPGICHNKLSFSPYFLCHIKCPLPYLIAQCVIWEKKFNFKP
jgi:hypothetical protein